MSFPRGNFTQNCITHSRVDTFSISRISLFSTCFNSVRTSKISKIFCRISSSSIPSPISPISLGITEDGTASGASLIESYSVRKYWNQERIGQKQIAFCPVASALTPAVLKTNRSICQNYSESLLQQPTIEWKTLHDNGNRRKSHMHVPRNKERNNKKHKIREQFLNNSTSSSLLLRRLAMEL